MLTESRPVNPDDVLVAGAAIFATAGLGATVGTKGLKTGALALNGLKDLKFEFRPALLPHFEEVSVMLSSMLSSPIMKLGRRDPHTDCYMLSPSKLKLDWLVLSSDTASQRSARKLNLIEDWLSVVVTVTESPPSLLCLSPPSRSKLERSVGLPITTQLLILR